MRTSGISRLRWRCSAAISSVSGAPSSNSLTLSFNSRQALRSTSTETRIERIGSAGVQPVQIIISAAMIAPTEPSKSPITCSAAARTFRFFSSLPRCRTQKASTLASKPATAITIIMPPATGRGVWKRSMASQTIKMVITTNAMALTNAASVVSLSQPKVCRIVGGRWENRTASSAKRSAAASVSICPASANKASEPESNPPTTSTNINPAVMQNANIKRRALLSLGCSEEL